MPYHTGMFICTLLSLVFLIRSLKKFDIWNVMFLSISIILGIISNTLYHVYFTVPILIALVVLAIRDFKRYYPLILTILISFGASQLLMKFIPDMAYKLNLNSARKESFDLMVSSLIFIYKSSYILKLAIVLFITSFIYSSVISAKTIWKIITAGSKQINRYEFYHLYIVIVTIGSFIAPVYAGNFLELACIRYQMYSCFLGIFNIAIIFAHHSGNSNGKTIKRIALSFSFLAVIFVAVRSYSQNPFGAFSRFENYTNSLAIAVDSLSLKYPLKVCTRPSPSS